MKRLAIIGSVGIPASYGGFETLVENLVDNLADKLEIVVYCSSSAFPKKITEYKGARLIYLPFKANGWQSILYDCLGLLRSIKGYDACLVVGVSGAIAFPIIRAFSRARLVCNLDGSEWKREKWSVTAKLFLRLSERLAVTYSHTVISDSLIIKEFVREKYGMESQYIPYGGDHIVVKDFGEKIFDEFNLKKENYFLNISRIEPENNNKMILDAFSSMPQYDLVMIGNWKNSPYSQELFNDYKKKKNIHLLDAMFDRQCEKNYIRANCKAYIHGHSVGGTSPALVEALTLGRVPICYDVDYNRSTCGNLGLYFKTETDLIENIQQYDAIVDVDTMRKDLDRLCQKLYRWNIISMSYYRLFTQP